MELNELKTLTRELIKTAKESTYSPVYSEAQNLHSVIEQLIRARELHWEIVKERSIKASPVFSLAISILTREMINIK